MNEIWRPLAQMRKEKLWYSIVTRDRHGKVVSRERRKSHSLLVAWNKILWGQMQTGNIQVVQTNGVATNSSDYATNYDMRGAQSTKGIVVGTGVTPVDLEDYALEALIAHGTGAGQMSYPVGTIAQPVVAAPSCSFLISRPITNNSPGVITVKEAGIYFVIGSPAKYACAIRDILTVPQAVPIGGTITIDWTIGVTV